MINTKNSKDQIQTVGDIESQEILRLLRRATKQQISHLPSVFLEESTKLSKEREKAEQKRKEEFDKKTEKPRQKVQEAINLVEQAKQNIRESETEEDLFEAGTEYETALKQYQSAFNELSKIDTSTSNQCFDPIPPTDKINERQRFLGTMRKIWKEKVKK